MSLQPEIELTRCAISLPRGMVGNTGTARDELRLFTLSNDPSEFGRQLRELIERLKDIEIHHWLAYERAA